MKEQKGTTPVVPEVETPLTTYDDPYQNEFNKANSLLDQWRIVEKDFGRSAEVVFKGLVEEIRRLIKNL